MTTTAVRPLIVESVAPVAASRVAVRSRIFGLLAAISILGGAYLRFHNLGMYGFWNDELYHVHAAHSYVQNGSLNVPMYGEYTRALPITYITAYAFKYLGESEFSARIPFAVASVIFLVVSFFVIKRVMSLPLALLSTFSLAFSPLAVLISRECRMYAVFQLFYFCMAFAFFDGLENAPRRSRLPAPIARFEKRHEVNFLMLLACVAFFFCALSVHVLTFNFVFVLTAYVLGISSFRFFRGDRQFERHFKYSLLLLILAATFFGIYFLDHAMYQHILEKAVFIPDWLIYKDTHYFAYYMINHYPLYSFLYPLGVFFLMQRYGKRGFFIAVNFIVLFLMHSFIFERREDRYIYYIYPFFVMGAAAVLEVLFPALYDAMRLKLRAQPRWVVAVFLVMCIPATKAVTDPWLEETQEMFHHFRFIDWKNIDAPLKKEIAHSGVITTAPRAHEYYFHEKPAYYFMAERSPDYTYEDGIILTDSQLKDAVDDPRVKYFLTDKWAFANPAYMDDKMREYVMSKMKPVRNASDERIMILRKKEV